MSEKRKAPKSRKQSVARRTDKHGPKASFSFRRNVLPAIAGITIMLAVMGVLNGQYLIAQYKYHFSRPTIATSTSNIASTSGTTDNTNSPNPDRGPYLTIPTIGAEVPVVFEKGIAEWQIQTALRSGVVHYAGSVNPGDTGNVVIFGHSSGQSWAPGKYKFVFTLLDKLKTGDVIYVDNLGTRYTYQVHSSQVVTPGDIGVLKSGSDHELTLITCTPVGTSTNRLVIHAEQISPNPNADAAKTQAAPAVQALPIELPGSASQSIGDRIRDLF